MASKAQSRRSQIAAGFLVMAAGCGLAFLAATHLDKSLGRLDPVVLLIAGSVLVLMGAILVVPERSGKIKAWIGALMITSIALLFDWLAFGPGERSAASVIAGTSPARAHFWEVPGRVLLVSGALLFDLMALWAWMRALWGKHARA